MHRAHRAEPKNVNVFPKKKNASEIALRRNKKKMKKKKMCKFSFLFA